MRLMYYLPLAAFCMMAASCSPSRQKAGEASGLELANLDTTVVPGDDFYQFATGGWQKNNPLPAEYSRFGTFDQLADNNRKQLNDLIAELASKKHEAGSIAQKIGDFYNIIMDSVKLNKDGIAPVKGDLERVASIKDVNDVYVELAKLDKAGTTAYFGFYVAADEKNSTENAVQVGQAGLSMGQREYYLETDSATTKIRNAFREHVVRMYKLFGYDEVTAKQGMEIVMDVETQLAKAFRSRAELRDPQANYNKMTMHQLREAYPQFAWDTFLNEFGLPAGEVKEVIVGQPASLEEAVKVIAALPIEKQRLYLQWKVMNHAAGCLNDEIVEESFDFYSRTMRGVDKLQPRWKRAVNRVGSSLGEAVGQMYVEKYFPAAAKKRMAALVENLRVSLGERIKGLEWMSDETKQKALEKLSTFHVKIGYPDKWKDYSSLEIKDDSYYDNAKRASLWRHMEMLNRFGKPVDREEWFMTPQTVNAYYNPTTNEICFPAGILQYPFFDMEADDAFNYGAIGVVIGHEMTHGFDDQGRQYDKDGNLKDWWTAEDAEKFKERAQVMVDFFDNIEVAPGVHGNGKLTLGENIADHGGLKVAFQAFKAATAGNPLPVKDGFTPEQRFFLSYATVWAGNIRPEEILSRTKSDPHALGRWRVNGALPQIGAWYDAFNVTPESPMYLSEEKRVSIW